MKASTHLAPVRNDAKGLASLISWGIGPCCPTFLDTSAIIDIEYNLQEKKAKRHPSFIPTNFYFYLAEHLGKRLFVTDSVVDEVVDQNKNLIAGRPVISDETLNLMLLLNQSYQNFTARTRFEKDFGEMQRDTYWASLVAFDENHKKSYLDPISPNDKDLLARALHARYALGSTGSVILSSDSHISENAKVLTDSNPEASKRLYKLVSRGINGHYNGSGSNPPVVPKFGHVDFRAFNTSQNMEEI